MNKRKILLEKAGYSINLSIVEYEHVCVIVNDWYILSINLSIVEYELFFSFFIKIREIVLI